VLSAAVAGVVAVALPETLTAQHRSPVRVGAIRSAAMVALRNRVFVCFVLVFGLMASAQLTFGVAGPFLYQDGLGFAPAAYGLVALTVGMANLGGELACGVLATRVSARSLALGALAVFATGAAVLVVSAAVIGLNAWAITIGAGLALAGCGVLCPQMYGLALGLFTRNLGLIGGMVSAGGYLIVSVSMVAVGALPERTQAPLGWLYVTCGVMALVLLMWATSARRTRETAETKG